jgi:membrane transport protein XK
MLAKAYLYWKDSKYLIACIECSDLIWKKGLLKKGAGICHGIAGHGIVHLLVYRLTNDEKYLYRAYKFAEFLKTDLFKTEARTPDSPYSLFEGLAGTVCFILNLLDPKTSEFPLIPVF